MTNYNHSYDFDEIVKYSLLFLTICYIGFELYFNYLIIGQMAYASSTSQLSHIEIFGKILAGIGIGLIFTRLVRADAGYRDGIDFITKIVVYCAIGIAISFFVQNYLIKKITQNANPTVLAKSILITQAQTAQVPFHDDVGASGKSKESSFMGFYDIKDKVKQERIDYWQASQACIQKYVSNQSDTKIEKAFFPYLELQKDNFDEEKYKASIVKHSRCLLDNPKTFDRYVSGSQSIKKLYDIYSEYREKSFSYEEYRWNSKRPHQIEKLNERWVKESKKVFGQNSNIPPNLTMEQFYAHKDVKNYIIKQTGQSTFTDPTSKNFNNQVKTHVTNELFTNYDDYYRQYIFNDKYKDLTAKEALIKIWEKSSVGGKYEYIMEDLKDNPEKLKEFEESLNESFHDGREAYKAIIMPIVALAFSTFFILLNIVSLAASFIFRRNPGFIKIFTVIAMVILLALPSLMGRISQNYVVENTGFVAKITLGNIYLYQSILNKVFSRSDL